MSQYGTSLGEAKQVCIAFGKIRGRRIREENRENEHLSSAADRNSVLEARDPKNSIKSVRLFRHQLRHVSAVHPVNKW